MMAPLSAALCERSDYKLVRLNSRSYYGEILKLQSALNDDYTEQFFRKNQTLCLYVHFGAVSLIHSALQRCNTSQGFGAFSWHTVHATEIEIDQSELSTRGKLSFPTS